MKPSRVTRSRLTRAGLATDGDDHSFVYPLTVLGSGWQLNQSLRDVKVETKDRVGNTSILSPELGTVAPIQTAPDVVSGISAEATLTNPNSDDSYLTLTWTNPANAVRIYYQIVSNGATAPSTTDNATIIDPDGLTGELPTSYVEFGIRFINELDIYFWGGKHSG